MENKEKKFKIIHGDLFKLASDGEFDVIAQGCNCFNQQGAGIAVIFKKLFGTDKFPMELEGYGDKNKLGEIDYEERKYNGYDLTVVNCYTQYHYGWKYGAPLDYVALDNCLEKINSEFVGQRIGLPLIGGGLAGGDHKTIIETMKKKLVDCDVTLVLFEKK